jgi:hypothetical protein
MYKNEHTKMLLHNLQGHVYYCMEVTEEILKL